MGRSFQKAPLSTLREWTNPLLEGLFHLDAVLLFAIGKG
jgi:hypothetical protein